MSSSTIKPIAVISGASSGIGAVYADRFAARGYDLILVARRADRLEALAQKISQAYPVKAEVIIADLKDPADRDRVFALIDGVVKYEWKSNTKKQVSVYPAHS